MLGLRVILLILCGVLLSVGLFACSEGDPSSIQLENIPDIRIGDADINEQQLQASFLDEKACTEIGAESDSRLAIENGYHCEPGHSAVVHLLLANHEDLLIGTCTGTVVAKDIVLTAAHCLNGEVSKVLVQTGEALIPSAVLLVHPQYTDEPPEGVPGFPRDIGLVYTSRNLGTRKFAIHLSTEIELPSPALIAGYGEDAMEQVNGLHSGNMLISAVSSYSIFAEYQGTGSNTCPGDSGGPLLVQSGSGYAVAGIASSGGVDCGAGDTSVFVNLKDPKVEEFLLNNAPGIQIQ